MWAIYEAVSRVDPYSYSWRSVDARKDHECVRGCKISSGDVYFQQGGNGGWGSELKICASCTAMIFYYLNVDKLEPYNYTHWSIEENKPIEPQNPSRHLIRQMEASQKVDEFLKNVSKEISKDVSEDEEFQNKPGKEELEKLLWQMPTTKVAARYGVSDSAVGKWAKSYGIQKPPRGYWAKIRSQ
jgi:hypothetical protein